MTVNDLVARSPLEMPFPQAFLGEPADSSCSKQSIPEKESFAVSDQYPQSCSLKNQPSENCFFSMPIYLWMFKRWKYGKRLSASVLPQKGSETILLQKHQQNSQRLGLTSTAVPSCSFFEHNSSPHLSPSSDCSKGEKNVTAQAPTVPFTDDAPCENEATRLNSLEPHLSASCISSYLQCIITVHRLIRQGILPPAFLMRKLAELLSIDQTVSLVQQQPVILDLLNDKVRKCFGNFVIYVIAGRLQRWQRVEQQRSVSETRRRRAILRQLYRSQQSTEKDPRKVFCQSEKDLKRAQLELRLLKLRPFQARLRRNVLASQSAGSIDNASLWSEVFNNSDLQRRVDSAAHLTSTLSRECVFFLTETPLEQQLSRLQHSHLLRKVPLHRETLAVRWNSMKKLRQRCAKEAARRVESLCSKRELARERAQREHLKYLKEHDTEKYLELVKQSKDARIKTLLSQTDRFLASVRHKMIMQKSTTLEARKEQRISFQRWREQIDKDSPVRDAEALTSKNQLAQGPETSMDDALMTCKEDALLAEAEGVVTQPSSLTGGSLMPYQISGLQFLVYLYDNDLSGILADEMGLGKTVQTIAFLAYLKENRSVEGPHLIIVPLSTLPNWITEFRRWCPSLKILEFRGNRQERRQLASRLRRETFNICITTYDWIIRAKSTLSSPYWSLLIVDEGHRMKNIRSKFHTVLTEFHSTHRLLLTGTPLQNNLSELWSLLNFLLPKIFTSSADFELWFEEPFKNFHNAAAGSVSNAPTGHPYRVVNLTEEEKFLIINRLHSVLRPFLLRRVKKDVLNDLPDKREYVVRVQLSVWQKLAYQRLSNKAVRIQTCEGKVSQRSYANVMMQLRKVVNHPYLFEDEYFINENLYRVSGKFEVLDRMLPKLVHFGHKTLIFCQMTQIMDLLDDYFDFKGYQRCRLDGNTIIDERRDRVLQFNDPNSSILIFTLSTRAGGLGINLQAADTVIIFDSDWNPHQDLQAQARAHRFGQQKEVRVFRLVTVSGVEEAVLSKAQHKLDIDEKIIQAGMFNNRCTDEERQQRLRMLLNPKGIGTETCVTTPQELNRFLARTEEEEAFFQNYDKQLFGLELFNAFERNCALSTWPMPDTGTEAQTPASTEVSSYARTPKGSSFLDSGTGALSRSADTLCDAVATPLDTSVSGKTKRALRSAATMARPSDSTELVSQDAKEQSKFSLSSTPKLRKRARLDQEALLGSQTQHRSPPPLFPESLKSSQRKMRRPRGLQKDSDYAYQSFQENNVSATNLSSKVIENDNQRDDSDGASSSEMGKKYCRYDNLSVMTEEDLLIQSGRLMSADEIPTHWLVDDTETDTHEDNSTVSTLDRASRRARQSMYQEIRSPFSRVNTEALSEAAFDRALRRLETGEVPDFEMAVAIEKTRRESRRSRRLYSRLPFRRKRAKHSAYEQTNTQPLDTKCHSCDADAEQPINVAVSPTDSSLQSFSPTKEVFEVVKKKTRRRQSVVSLKSQSETCLTEPSSPRQSPPSSSLLPFSLPYRNSSRRSVVFKTDGVAFKQQVELNKKHPSPSGSLSVLHLRSKPRSSVSLSSSPSINNPAISVPQQNKQQRYEDPGPLPLLHEKPPRPPLSKRVSLSPLRAPPNHQGTPRSTRRRVCRLNENDV